MTTEELNFDPSMRTCMQAIEGLRSINEKADRANLTNYQIQLENGYMDVYLYQHLSGLIFDRRPDWNQAEVPQAS